MEAVIIMILVGAGFLIKSLNNIIVGNASYDWPSTEGTIVDSEIEVVPDEMSVVHYRPKISYKYAIDGIQYYSDHYTFRNDLLYSETEADEVLKNYITNMDIPVYYHPADPTVAVLLRGRDNGSIGGCIMVMLFVLIGLFIFLSL